MDRLIFSGGGQPLYIDDLQLMQDNQAALGRTLTAWAMGGATACLTDDVSVKTLEPTATGRRVSVARGCLVTDGMALPFAGAELDVRETDDVYVCLHRTTSDLRTFDDGQQHYCRESITASLSTTGTGAWRAYRLAELPTLAGLLAGRLQTTQDGGVDVNFANGYSGRVLASKAGDDWNVIVDVRTFHTAWDAEAEGFKGLLFVVRDTEFARLLAGRRTPAFILGDRTFFLDFYTSGMCVLTPEGVSNIYDDNVEIPLAQVFLSFSLNHMTIIS